MPEKCHRDRRCVWWGSIPPFSVVAGRDERSGNEKGGGSGAKFSDERGGKLGILSLCPLSSLLSPSRLFSPSSASPPTPHPH